MTDRCEPPPEWRDRDGWHWIKGPYSTGPLLWIASKTGQWQRPGDDDQSPAELAQIGCSYVAPVTPSAEVEALRAERDALLAQAHISGRQNVWLCSRVAELEAALTSARAALTKETPDV